jgi:hypothetical protein
MFASESGILRLTASLVSEQRRKQTTEALQTGQVTGLPEQEVEDDTAEAPCKFEWVEARANSWNGAADSIIDKLCTAGVKRGQIITIDAHNNGPDGAAIFSAHYSRSYPDKGDLQLQYDCQNTSEYGWHEFYERANSHAKSFADDIIGITSSCNCEGRGVTYVFRYAPPSTEVPRELEWVEARADSWDGAADEIIKKIQAKGAR